MVSLEMLVNHDLEPSAAQRGWGFRCLCSVQSRRGELLTTFGNARGGPEGTERGGDAQPGAAQQGVTSLPRHPVAVSLNSLQAAGRQVALPSRISHLNRQQHIALPVSAPLVHVPTPAARAGRRLSGASVRVSDHPFVSPRPQPCCSAPLQTSVAKPLWSISMVLGLGNLQYPYRVAVLPYAVARRNS